MLQIHISSLGNVQGMELGTCVGKGIEECLGSGVGEMVQEIELRKCVGNEI
jgi:hypothetical protein